MEGLNVGLTRRYGVAGVYGPLRREGGFDPLTLSPALWLKADAGTKQTSGGSAATADGDPVGQWLDQSGNNNHASQATAGFRPTLKLNQINGLPTVRWDGVDDFMSLTGLTAPSGSFYFAAVLTPPTGNLKYLFDAATGRLIITPRTDAGSVGWYDGAWKSIAASAAGAQFLEWVLTSGGNGQVYRNGTSLGTAAYTATAIGGTINLGTGGTSYNADVAEFMLCTTLPTAEQRTSMRSYVTSRYGI